ncbi:MAG: ABC transporter substrate-binding protein, partial [Hyphomicrobiales bacterium]|nr:ABC transporter substrate-binding protein [Hyphomicrobiales bacterium]
MTPIRNLSSAALIALLAASPALAADDTVTIGLVLPMTGPSASTGKQERAGAELYMQQHGDT